jgi:site-specific DNA recombinase
MRKAKTGRQTAAAGALARAIASTAAAMTTPGIKRAVIYLRVSSSAQADKDYNSEGYSLPAQRAACARKATGLGAEIVDEFVERGESGKSTLRREALAKMLERLGQGDIDYVVIHKVDRLARRRADDATIAEAIRKSGAQLVSVSENIDETPSGMLMHGIMASIAEFYSLNLAAEVMKGTSEKARRGGTPGRPPIGYVNSREVVEDREVRTIAIDPERGHHISAAFELYATGGYSLSETAAILEERGLRNRPRRGNPTTPLGPNRLQKILRNDYYVGVVRYADIVAEGRHPKLTDEATFQRVQGVLDSQRQSGERCWRHHSYLRGTVFCGDCDKRLIYTRATGRRGGTYEYLVCSGRLDGTCSQPHHRLEAVEEAVARRYETIELTASRRQKIREAVHAHAEHLDAGAEPERERVRQKLIKLAGEEKKLLQAHYDENISRELFAEEQRRVRSERVAAELRQAQLDVDHSQILEALEVALGLTDRIETAYRAADPSTRRLFNQAIFERIWIDREDVQKAILASPIREVLALDDAEARSSKELGRRIGDVSSGRETRTTACRVRHLKKTPTDARFRGGSNVERMVRLRGFEPPRPEGHGHLKPGRLPVPPQPRRA